MKSQKSRPTLGRYFLATLCGASLIAVLVACGSSTQSVAGRIETSSLTAVEVSDVQHFGNGAVTLAPPSHPEALTADIRSRIEANQTVNGLLSKGYDAKVEYGDYTSNNYGSPIAGLDPEKAAAMKPNASERQQLAASGNKIQPRYDNLPIWFVFFDNVPPTAIPELIHPGVTSDSASAGPSTRASDPENVGTVAVVFSGDAETQLQVLTFPTGTSGGK